MMSTWRCCDDSFLMDFELVAVRAVILFALSHVCSDIYVLIPLYKVEYCWATDAISQITEILNCSF